jgi:hypothetical protein
MSSWSCVNVSQCFGVLVHRDVAHGVFSEIVRGGRREPLRPTAFTWVLHPVGHPYSPSLCV